MIRQRRTLVLVLLVTLAAVVGVAFTNPVTLSRLLHPAAAERDQVEEVARRSLGPSIPTPVLDRARVEVIHTDQGWQVLFHDAWVSCEQLRWPEACGMPAPGPPSGRSAPRPRLSCIETCVSASLQMDGPCTSLVPAHVRSARPIFLAGHRRRRR